MLTFYFVGLPAICLEQWTIEVMALPERKRLKWKSHLLHVKGELCMVRWRPDGFVCYLNEAQKADARKKNSITPADGWAPIYALGEMISDAQVRCCYGDAAAQFHAEHRNDWFARNADLYREYGVREHLQRHNDGIERHHTGNHYRKQKISIPVSPGQPLRG